MKKRRLIIILLSTLCLSQCVSMVRYGVKDGQNLPADFVTQQKIDAALAFSDMELFSQIDIWCGHIAICIGREVIRRVSWDKGRVSGFDLCAHTTWVL